MPRHPRAPGPIARACATWPRPQSRSGAISLTSELRSTTACGLSEAKNPSTLPAIEPMGFAGAQPILQRQVPVLAHHRLTETAPPLAGRELKSRALVDVPCRGEHFVGPQSDPLISASAGEADAFICEPATQAAPARNRI